MPKLFPKKDSINFLICIPGIGVTKDFSCLIAITIPDLEFMVKCQCFPLYYYEKRQTQQPTLFDRREKQREFTRHDGVSDFILERARKQYSRLVTKVENLPKVTFG